MGVGVGVEPLLSGTPASKEKEFLMTGLGLLLTAWTVRPLAVEISRPLPSCVPIAAAGSERNEWALSEMSPGQAKLASTSGSGNSTSSDVVQPGSSSATHSLAI